MNYIGNWKLHSIMTFDQSDTPVYLTPEQYLESPMPYIDESDEEAVADEIKERKKTIGSKLKICEDGNLYMLMPLPEGISQEEVDQAVAAGIIKVIDGYQADDPKSWEIRDDILYFDTGIEGEVLGEKTDGWITPINENGLFCFMNFRYVKED